jgi:methionyl-tRNA formyltransferase
MTKKSARLIFFGNERLSTGFQPHGAPTLEALIAHGYDIAAVVSNFEYAKSRNARELEIAGVAKQHNIPVLLPKKLSEISEELRAFHADAGILVAYGKMIPQSIIDLFPRGIVNIHPSLLPLYRGSTPIEQAIRDGAPETGVSLMQLVKTMDAGPIFAQARVQLKGAETKHALTQELLRLGSEILITHLPAILDGILLPTPQDEAKATYTTLLTKADAVLDWYQPAEVLERQIRAFAGWPQARGTLQISDSLRLEVVITAAQVTDQSLTPGEVIAKNNQLLVGTPSQALQITSLKIPGKKEISASDFIRGYHL